ncbi:MAG: DUF3048 domain-containing protein [Anaerolineales bacterium]|nr:MAG: DUF3048 domain-containing protein [Anaerolineales bacterium]
MSLMRISGRAASRSLSSLRRFGLPGLFLFLLAACASASPEPTASPIPFVTPDGLATSTPFQPGGDAPAPAEVAATRLPPVTPNFTRTAPAPTPTSAVSNSLDLIVDINPLTGLPPSDPKLLERRPLAIKISNYPRAIRPQYGLTLADQAFEYYIEWGATRFIGVFYGNDSKQVGPVRSGRFFDEHVARMYQAFLVFNYADPREWNYLKESDLYPYLVIPSCYGNLCPPFFISNAKQLPDERHLTNYFDTTRFADYIAQRGVNNSRQQIRNGFFSEQVPEARTRVKRVYTFYSTDSYNFWEYDEATRQYFRSEEVAAVDLDAGVPESYEALIDAATGRQVSAQNLVTLFVSHTFSNEFNAEDEVYHINLVNSGRAYVFRDGVVIPARWIRQAYDQPLLLATLEGAPIYLRPGRTFYEVIGMRSTLTEDGDEWRFQFHTP